jgi:hypothetical protein
MVRKLRIKGGRQIYRKRSQSVEPMFGQHVNRGLDEFILRGETGAKAGWSLYSATHNLMKLHRLRQPYRLIVPGTSIALRDPREFGTGSSTTLCSLFRN